MLTRFPAATLSNDIQIRAGPLAGFAIFALP